MNYEQVSRFDLQFKHPFAMLVCGPSQCGKTEFTRTLIEKSDIWFTEPPQRIIWAYGQYQKRYDDDTNKFIEYHEGIDSDLVQSIDGTAPTLLVLDDMMSDLGSSKMASDLFTRGVHHKNLSVVFILQNLFFQAKEMRTISLNSQYFVLFENSRDVSQIRTLGKQLCPTNSKFLVEIYKDAVSTRYGHLLIDIHPRSIKSLKFRSNVFRDSSHVLMYKERSGAGGNAK
jgi:hypothetical protein